MADNRISPALIQRRLHGMHYPARWDDLVSRASSRGADASVVDVLGRLPDVDYTDEDAVVAVVADVE